MDHFLQHAHDLVGRKANEWWVVGWCAILWILWSQPTEMVFEGKEFDNEKVWHKILFFYSHGWKLFKEIFFLSHISIAKSLWTMGYEVFLYQLWQADLSASLAIFKFVGGLSTILVWFLELVSIYLDLVPLWCIWFCCLIDFALSNYAVLWEPWRCNYY